MRAGFGLNVSDYSDAGTIFWGLGLHDVADDLDHGGDLLERSDCTAHDGPAREAPGGIGAREGLDVHHLLDRHGEAFDLLPKPADGDAKSLDCLGHGAPSVPDKQTTCRRLLSFMLARGQGRQYADECRGVPVRDLQTAGHGRLMAPLPRRNDATRAL